MFSNLHTNISDKQYGVSDNFSRKGGDRETWGLIKKACWKYLSIKITQ